MTEPGRGWEKDTPAQLHWARRRSDPSEEEVKGLGGRGTGKDGEVVVGEGFQMVGS